MSTKIIFGFDVGLGSLGTAVRQGDEIVHADSLLIDAEVATIQEQAEKRRQFRTRKTHKMREKWWQHIWEMIGEKPLKGIEVFKDENGEWQASKGDERLEREFPEKDDNTIYTSCLLRIKLLQGEELEKWQIYKAIRSAFIRAGYPDVPWTKNQKDDKDEKKRTSDFTEELEKIFKNSNHRFPCYYDAYQMGLFDAETGKIQIRQSNKANRARGYTAPRDLVEKELRLLLEQAAKQIPELKTKIPTKKWQEYILFGPELEAFNDTRIQGILDQKKAQFDNRCVNHCSQISRFKVTRAENILYFQTHFLLKLCNMVVEKNKQNEKLTPQERKEWYEKVEEERHKYMEEFFAKGGKKLTEDDYKKIANKYKSTKTQWKKWCEEKGYKINLGTSEIAAPKISGRTGFSRPAMLLLRTFILSGLGAHDFREKILAENFKSFEKFNLKEEDLDFLKNIKGNDPQNIYLPSISLKEKFLNKNTGDIKEAVQKLIGSTRHSVVRHRLMIFFKRLQDLEKKFGTPDQIIIEFAREDFSTKDSKKKYESDSKENNKLFETAKKELRDTFGIDYRKQNENLVRKYMMWEKQGHICPYTGQTLSFEKLPEYEIEHIIPRGNRWNGPDDIKNTVLTTSAENKKKGDNMPFEYILDEDWEAFKERVNTMKISGKTKKILLARTEEVEKLIDRYYGLATTGWVARMARDISCLWFGWQPNAEGEKRKLHTVSGSLVGKVRRKFGLNKALNPFLSKADAEKDEKNRDDKRHHALDAMVMTYLDEYMRNPRNFTKLQKELGEMFGKLGGARYFEEKLADVMPYKIARNKAKLGETAYRVIEQQTVAEKRGKKVLKKENILVGRVPLFTLEKGKIKVVNVKNIIDPNIRAEIENFLSTKPDEEQKKKFFENYPVKKITVKKGKPDNLKDLSKNPNARGQYYESKSITGTGTLQHGVYLYSRDGENWKVEPVYAFRSPYRTKQRLLNQGFQIKDNALFYAGCIVEVTENIEGKDVDRGKYTVKTIESNGTIKLQNFKGDIFRFAISLLKNNFHFIK